MAKPTGFMEYARCENPLRPECERIGDFDALHAALPEDARRQQAARCMNCGVPYCQSSFGCPLNNLIPEWNDLLYRGHPRAALDRLLRTAPFPEFTGRVCPALCEKACMMADAGAPGATTNRDNELYLIEEGFSRGWIQPRVPPVRTGRRAAVVGSGPSGLAAADLLNRLGHDVTVFERADRPGGLLMYGIPNMKLPKRVVERRIRLMESEGVRFRTGVNADADAVAGFDAALLCIGARRPRALNVPGQDARGVHFAVDFLTEATRALLEGRSPAITASDCDVVIVGGGDTGNDCVGTCMRQGCRSMTELEMMPAAPDDRRPDNPWPQWPRTLRTDYGQLESMRVFGRDPRRFETTVEAVHADEGGRVRAVQIARLKRAPDGRFAPVPDSRRVIPCQLLLIAAGFLGCETAAAETFGFDIGPRGNPVTPDGSHALGPGLFTAGDMHTGQSLVVRAIADGRAAAREAHAHLTAMRK